MSDGPAYMNVVVEAYQEQSRDKEGPLSTGWLRRVPWSHKWPSVVSICFWWLFSTYLILRHNNPYMLNFYTLCMIFTLSELRYWRKQAFNWWVPNNVWATLLATMLLQQKLLSKRRLKALRESIPPQMWAEAHEFLMQLYTNPAFKEMSDQMLGRLAEKIKEREASGEDWKDD